MNNEDFPLSPARTYFASDKNVEYGSGTGRTFHFQCLYIKHFHKEIVPVPGLIFFER